MEGIVRFDEAVRALRAGQLDDAELACRKLLRAAPTHDGSMNVLGVIALLRGQAAQARDFVEKALALQPLNASYHVNLAKILNSLGCPSEAEEHFREALRLDPINVDGHLGLGHMLRTQRRFDEASICFFDLVRLQPDDPDLHAIYGNVLQDVGRLRDAELHYREACRLKPDYPEVFNNLGNLLQMVGRPSEAEAYFRQALSLRPDFPEACNNLGNLLRECRRSSEAETYCREALRLRPDYAMAHNNLANALRECDDYETAEFHYREAIRLKPDYAEAHNNLGALFGDLGQLDRARTFYHEAIELRPDYLEAHSNLGMTLLGAGKFEEGWRTYDTYRKIAERADLTGPQWEGDDLNGRVLLVYAEQGFGDVIQFSRFVPLVGAGARVIFEVPRELVALLTGLPGINRIVARGDSLPHYDVHCALMSLPRWLGITLDRIRGDAPYLSVDPKRVAKWRSRVETLPGLRVGLAWAGNPALVNDRRRSISLDRLGGLTDVPGVSFISLQKGIAAAQTSSPPPGMIVSDWTAELYDFADTAALISTLDIVITVDTSVVHLAGALGRPVWLLNRFNSCWRWLFDQASSPWYATLRQFKQPRPGDWDSVIQQVKTNLMTRAVETIALSSHVFEDARKKHEAGRLDHAETIYRRLLAIDPLDAESLHFLGVVHFQRGQNELAVDYITKAIDLQPQNSNSQYNLANALNALGRHADAEIRYREALRLKPDNVDAHGALGTMLQGIGHLDEAESHLREALRLNPQSGVACNNLGIMLCRRDRLEEAEAKFREALRRSPNFAAAHANLGSILRHRRELDEAEKHCRQALSLNLDLAEGHFVLAQVLETREQYEEAERHYREAVRLKPDCADWHNDLAKLLLEMRRLQDAQPWFNEALRLRSDHPETHSNLAIAMLLTGNYKEGWQEYEWRWKLRKRPGRLDDFSQPVWDGQNINGRTLLVHAEQGFGDTIQFCRLVSLLGSQARVILEVQRPLATLLADLPGVDQIVARGDPLPHFDVHCPLLSLPRLLGTSLTHIAGQVPYLSADPTRVAKWRDRLCQIPGLRVGVAWAGSPTMADDRRRSIAPDRLAALADIPGVSFVSLQKSATEQACSAPSGMVLHDWTDEFHDFADTAALIANLDLTISVDTAVIHVAGALGRPVWLLNRFSGCWRWLLEREDSPWYPTLRQFRQPRPGDWDSALLKVKAALNQEVKRHDPEAMLMLSRAV
jgi:tetratricopeptide (TPR) repeat protein